MLRYNSGNSEKPFKRGFSENTKSLTCIGTGHTVTYGELSSASGAVAIGDHAHIDDYVNQEGSIAIGKNAFAENLFGIQEKFFNFGQRDTEKWASSVAIGQIRMLVADWRSQIYWKTRRRSG